MKPELVIPADPKPIIESMGFAYAIENAAGDIVVAATVLMRSDAKDGGFRTDGIDMVDAARASADSVVRFAISMGKDAVRVRCLTPQEYADWCAENDDDDDADEDGSEEDEDD